MFRFIIPKQLFKKPHVFILIYYLFSDVKLPELNVAFQVSSREGYISENAEIGTTVRVSPNPQAESLQILVNDEDLRPGMPPATYQYILTGPGATIFAVDQRGYLYLNVASIDADMPNPSSYKLNVSLHRSSGEIRLESFHIHRCMDRASLFLNFEKLFF
ncbi:unnamed protein product [Nippostrongylus brasiliensis]|uniref:Cadherin domain-containing protein n=1 Tax=Nippostrongylus brasiliensis TaxID=27835 RepID=A0A3P7AE37_NIPBR|nr:unnamed protein product [Nippostrongylus brasiliensis]